MPATLTAPLPTNQVPALNANKEETGCCPRFSPEPWEGQHLHFEKKPFVKATTKSVFHVPVNMTAVFKETFEAITKAGAVSGAFPILSRDESAWRGEHLFAVDRPVPGLEMVELSGDFLTKVFEGPYSDARRWCKEMEHYVEREGRRLDTLYYFYTTCPNCAKHYGKNYVVALAKVR